MTLLSVGIVGYLRDRMNILERGLLIVAACIMTFDPMDLSITGLAPVAVSLLVVGLHVYRHGSGAVENQPRF